MNENEQRKEKSILKLYFAKIVVNDRYIWEKKWTHHGNIFLLAQYPSVYCGININLLLVNIAL